jgi:hypothetical protein
VVITTTGMRVSGRAEWPGGAGMMGGVTAINGEAISAS